MDKHKAASAMSRDYKQTARAEAAEETRRRITEAFSACWRERWYDEITLEEVAQRAEVSVRTVIRQFGGKAGLIQGIVQYVSPEIEARRTVTPGDIDHAIERLFENYEADGDANVRTLAQEGRLPALTPLIEIGREGHRGLAARNFAPWLDALPDAAREQTLDALVVATDVYTWKLLRRDLGRSEAEAKAIVRLMVDAMLAGVPTDSRDPQSR